MKRKYDEQTLLTLQRLRLVDDDLFRFAATYHRQGIATAIRRALEIEADVEAAEPQKELNRIEGAKIKVDLHLALSDGSLVAFEVQKDKRGFPYQRLEVYLGYETAYAFAKAGWVYRRKGRVWLVLVSPKDMVGGKKGRYDYYLSCKTEEEPLGGKEAMRVTLINAEYADPSTPWGRLALDFMQSDPKNIMDINLQEIMRKIKYDQEGENTMCEAIRQLRSQSRKEGVLAGMRKGRKEGRREGMLEGERKGRREGRIEGLDEANGRFRAQLAEAYLAKEIALPAACRMAGMNESDFLALAAEGPSDGR